MWHSKHSLRLLRTLLTHHHLQHSSYVLPLLCLATKCIMSALHEEGLAGQVFHQQDHFTTSNQLPNVVSACSNCTEEVGVPSSKPIYPSAGVFSISLPPCVTPSGRGSCSVDGSASLGWYPLQVGMCVGSGIILECHMPYACVWHVHIN